MKNEVRVVMLGAGFIAQTHSNALTRIKASRRGGELNVRLVAICDKNQELAKQAQLRFGYERVYDDFEKMLKEEQYDLFVNASPNILHGCASILAAEQGAAVICEKPLAQTADEAYDIWKKVDACGVTHMTAFEWRAIPAIRVAREMIQSGELGEVLHYRSNLFENMVDPDGGLSWRFSRKIAGTGAIGDLGSHHFDVARYLCGEFKSVCATTLTKCVDPKGIVTDVNDDSFACCAELENGVIAAMSASRITPGHHLRSVIEVDGTKGSIMYELERFNELKICMPGKGVMTKMIDDVEHPNADFYIPVGIQGSYPFGLIDAFAMEDIVIVDAVKYEHSIGQFGTFKDGYRVAEIVDTIERSSVSRKFEDVIFRD